MNRQVQMQADVEKVIQHYAFGMRKHLRQDPIRQSLRIAYRRWRELQGGGTVPRPPPAKHESGAVEVPRFLQPPPLKYAGFRGPWLEEYFGREYGGGKFPGARYLPILWDNFFAHAQGHTYLPSEFAARFRAIWGLLARLAATDHAYFTLQGIYEYPIWNWHWFPRNIIVLASAGYGDLALPLLLGDRPLRERPKDIRVSFMGRIQTHPVRMQTYECFKDVATFGFGPKWEEIMERSHFSLCPRGNGPTSFRLFEALSAVSIPVYIWERWLWLPYKEEIDWADFSLVTEASELGTARSLVSSMPKAEIQRRQQNIREIYDDYFSYRGVTRWIFRRMASVPDRIAASSLTDRRDDFRF